MYNRAQVIASQRTNSMVEEFGSKFRKILKVKKHQSYKKSQIVRCVLSLRFFVTILIMLASTVS